MISVIAKALNINKSEWSKVTILSAYSASALGVMVIIQSLITALFLEAYDTEFLPYLFASQALFLMLYTLITTSRNVSSKKSSGPFKLLILVASVIGVSRLLVGFEASWTIFVLYIILQTASELLVVNSWIVATTQLNSREAKRILPVISSGGRIGALLGGVAVSSLALYIGTENLLLVCILIIGGMFIMAKSIYSVPQLEEADTGAKKKVKKKGKGLISSLREIAGDLVNDRLMLIFVIIFSCLIVANTIVDYQFKGVLKANYTKDEIAAFIGAFYFFLSIMGFIFQLFLTSRLLVLLGLAAGIALMPSLMAVVSVAFLLIPGIWVITGVRVVENVLKYSVYKSSTGLLFMPYSKLKRENLNITIEGIFKPIAILFASVLMIVLNKFSVSLQLMSIVTIVACIIAAVSAFKLKAHYIKKLNTSLSNRRVRLTEDPELSGMIDSEFISVLETNLSASEITSVQFSLQLIREKHLPINTDNLYPLMTNDDPLVAQEAIETLGTIGEAKDIKKLYEVLQITSDEVITVACLRALRVIGGAPINEHISKLLEVGHGNIRSEAMLLMLNGDDESIKLANTLLSNMLESTTVENLSAASYIIGEARLTDYTLLLLELFGQKDITVLREAIKAAGKLAVAKPENHLSDEILEQLTKSFLKRKTGQLTRAAIASYGEDAIPILIGQYECVDKRIKFGIISTLGSIRSKGSVGELFRIVFSEPEHFKHRAIAMLHKLNSVVNIKKDGDNIDKAVFQRAEHCDSLMEASQMLQAAPEETFKTREHLKQFLLDELWFKTRLTIEDVFSLLGLRYDQKTIYRIFLNSMGSSVENRANALELFENIVEKDTALRITPLLEDLYGQSGDTKKASTSIELSSTDGLTAWGEDTDDPWIIKLASWITKGDKKDMDIIERIFFFKNLDLFSQLSGEQIKPIAEMFEEEMLPAGEVVFRKGDPSEYLYVILSGKVSVFVDDREVATLGAGEYFGDMALLDDEPRSATITLLQDTELLTLYREDFYEILDEYPEISRSIIRTLSMRLRASS
jgi:AAA family ATP:ADP antiporter